MMYPKQKDHMYHLYQDHHKHNQSQDEAYFAKILLQIIRKHETLLEKC